MRLNIKNILETMKIMGEYLFPLKKITNKFKSINSKKDLENFVQERSAHVVQTTLYGYLKTRIGTRYALMVEDEKFAESINIAKWNIYVAAISDLTFYVFSYFYYFVAFHNSFWCPFFSFNYDSYVYVPYHYLIFFT